MKSSMYIKIIIVFLFLGFNVAYAKITCPKVQELRSIKEYRLIKTYFNSSWYWEFFASGSFNTQYSWGFSMPLGTKPEPEEEARKRIPEALSTLTFDDGPNTDRMGLTSCTYTNEFGTGLTVTHAY